MRLKHIPPTAGQGMTFAEAIIMIAISAVILIGAITVSWRILGAGVKISVSNELTANGRLALERIAQAIQESDAVKTSSSVFGSNPSKLVLDFPGDGTDMIIDTYTASVVYGGQSITVRKLRIQEGAGQPTDITNNTVNVANFVVFNRQRQAEPANLQIELVLQPLTAGQDPLRNRTLNLKTSVSLTH